MTMVIRIAPANMKRRKNSQRIVTKKSVSFGESVAHEVDATSPEEAPHVWYNKEELDHLLQMERVGLWESQRTTKLDDDSFTPRGLESKLLVPGSKSNHVRHVLRIYRLKQKKAPVDPEDLRKTSQHSSKHNAKFALEQGRNDFLEVHGKTPLLKRANGRLSRIFR